MKQVGIGLLCVVGLFFPVERAVVVAEAWPIETSSQGSEDPNIKQADLPRRRSLTNDVAICLQLVSVSILLYLWRKTHPQPVAGVALTTALAAFVLLVTGESPVYVAFYAINTFSTLVTWFRAITDRHGRVFFGVACLCTCVHSLGKIQGHVVPLPALVLTNALVGFFFFRLYKKSPQKIHAISGTLWSVASVLFDERLLPMSLTTMLWSEALSIVYISSAQDSAPYEVTELHDLETNNE